MAMNQRATFITRCGLATDSGDDVSIPLARALNSLAKARTVLDRSTATAR
jgi:hypothetical protein